MHFDDEYGVNGQAANGENHWSSFANEFVLQVSSKGIKNFIKDVQLSKL